MPRTAARSVIDTYCRIHDQALALAERMDEAQLLWQAPRSGHSPAFHLWHVARWADHLQAAIGGMTAELGSRLGVRPQVWEQERFAERWGWSGGALGFGETGMSMDDDVAAQLVFPPRDQLLAYLRAAVAAAQEAVRAVDDTQFDALEQEQPLTAGIWVAGSTVGDVILAHVIHSSRHLGMVEALRGVQAGAGTATV
jgi:hypothetical protein